MAAGDQSGGTARRAIEIRLAVLAVLLATAAVYIQTLNTSSSTTTIPDRGNLAVQLLEDDPALFHGNVWAWKRTYAPTPYYRPLFLVSLLVQHKLFGQTAMGWHFTSVALHVLVTLLAYFLARRLTDDWLIAFLAAAIFGLHPVHIEAVDWVSAVNEPAAAAAVVGSFLCYLQRGRTWQAASLALYAVALLTKENALALLPLLWCYEWLQSPGNAFGNGSSSLWQRRCRTWRSRCCSWESATRPWATFRW